MAATAVLYCVNIARTLVRPQKKKYKEAQKALLAVRAGRIVKPILAAHLNAAVPAYDGPALPTAVTKTQHAEYLGSKLTLGPQYVALVQAELPAALQCKTYCEPFYGAGGLARAFEPVFASQDATVWVNDLETYSVALATAAHLPSLCHDALNKQPEVDGHIAARYGKGGVDARGFWSHSNARRLDGQRALLKTMKAGPLKVAAIGEMLSAADLRGGHNGGIYCAELKKVPARLNNDINVRPLYLGHRFGRVIITQNDAREVAVAVPEDTFLVMDLPYQTDTVRNYGDNKAPLNVIGCVDSDVPCRAADDKGGKMLEGYNDSPYYHRETYLEEVAYISANTQARYMLLCCSSDAPDGLPAAIQHAIESNGWTVQAAQLGQARFKCHTHGDHDTSALKELVLLGTRTREVAGAPITRVDLARNTALNVIADITPAPVVQV